MREAEIAARDEKWSPRKLFSKQMIYLLYALAAVLLLFTVTTKNSFLLFLFLTVFSTTVNYQTNMTPIRFNPAPEVFSALLLARVLPFPFTLFMLVVPTLLVDIYTARLDLDTLISLIMTVIISFLMSKFMLLGFVFFGIVLVTVKLLACLAINTLIEVPPDEMLFEHVLGYVVNVMLLLVCGNFFYSLFAR